MSKKKQWYLENIGHIKEYNRQYRLDNPEKYLLRKAAHNAKESNREFNIEVSDVIIPDICPVLGIPIYLKQDGSVNDNSPSLDRFDNSKGYIKDNVNVISWKANKLKGSATISELKKLVKWMENGTHRS